MIGTARSKIKFCLFLTSLEHKIEFEFKILNQNILLYKDIAYHIKIRLIIINMLTYNAPLLDFIFKPQIGPQYKNLDKLYFPNITWKASAQL